MHKLDNNNLIRSASYASVIVASLIMLIKSYGWFITNSQSMLASLIDSMLDISSSIINFAATRIALSPPDDNHRFGHDKFQDLAIFSQSIFFFFSGVFALILSVQKLISADLPTKQEFGVNIMCICILLTFTLVSYQTYVINRTKSKIIATDKLHYFTDLLSNIAVVVSLYLSAKFWFVDSLIGVCISIYITYNSHDFFREAIRNLSDEEFPSCDKDKIVKIISSHKEVKGIHDLKTRSAGSKSFIQFHIEINPEMNVLEAHKLSDNITKDLLTQFPQSEIILHHDPEGVEENVQYREKI